MNEQWEALAHEAGIAAEQMAIGITALGKATYAFPAYYGQAFFALTTGFERSCKLALVVDHAVLNDGIFPPESEFRRYGHNLRQLLDEADRISERLNSAGGLDRLPRSPTHIAIIEILSDFASNVTRYYNLDLLVGTARTDQLLNRDAVQGSAVRLGKVEHPPHGAFIVAVTIAGNGRTLALPKSHKRLSDHFLGGLEVTRSQLIVDDPFLLGIQMDIHTRKTPTDHQFLPA